MGWLKDFFKPQQQVRENYVRNQEERMNKGVDSGDSMWVTWKYIRNQPFESGPLGFYTWMLAVRKGLKSGEIDPQKIIDLLGLEEL